MPKKLKLACSALSVAGVISGTATIGRGRNNAIVFPYTAGTISRHHLAFTLTDEDEYCVSNISDGGEVSISGKELAPGEVHQLGDNDKISVGGYELETTFEEPDLEAAPPEQSAAPPPSRVSNDADGNDFPVETLVSAAVAGAAVAGLVASGLGAGSPSEIAVPSLPDVTIPQLPDAIPMPELPDVMSTPQLPDVMSTPQLPDVMPTQEPLATPANPPLQSVNIPEPPKPEPPKQEPPKQEPPKQDPPKSAQDSKPAASSNNGSMVEGLDWPLDNNKLCHPDNNPIGGKYGMVRSQYLDHNKKPVNGKQYEGHKPSPWPHHGWDLHAEVGKPCYAVADGVVVETYRDAPLDKHVKGSYGNFIILKLSLAGYKDIYAFYGHLHSVEVKNKDTVKIGDLIGHTGKTGNASKGKPHLHLEFRKKAKTADLSKERGGLPDRYNPVGLYGDAIFKTRGGIARAAKK